MRRLNVALLTVILVFITGWLLYKFHFFSSFTNLFQQQQITIDKTAVLVKDIKSLAQLITISAYDEIVVDSTATPVSGEGFSKFFTPLGLPRMSPEEKKVVIIGKVTTYAGINLQKIKANALYTKGDSIHIILPPAQILDVILNPSDVELFIEKGDWDNTSITNLKNKIKYIAAETARSKGLLLQSEQKGKEVLKAFFRSAGFQKVAVDIEYDR